MKCPFLVKRKEIYDKDGKRIAEEIELKDCIKNECMVYDGSAKLCSFLSTNIKNGIIIEEFKNGIKAVKEEMFQRTEALGVIISTTIQTLQDALLGRFDVLKKQNEVIALGFDRLSEIQGSLIDAIRNSSREVTEHINNLLTTFKSAGDNIKALEGIIDTIAQGQARLADETKDLLNGLKGDFEKLGNVFGSSTEPLKNEIARLITTYQIGVEAINGEINKSNLTLAEILKKFENFDNLLNSINSIGDLMKSESAGVKAEFVNSLGTLIGKFDEFRILFVDTLNLYKSEIEALNNKSQELINTFNARFEDFKAVFADATRSNKEDLQSLLQRLQTITDNIPANLKETSEMLKNEIGVFKNESVVILSNLQGGLDRLTEFLREIQNSLVKLHDTIEVTNRNYLEALGRFSSLGDGLRANFEGLGAELKERFAEYLKTLNEELGIIENRVANPVASIQTNISQFEDYLGKINTSIANMSEMMNNLNRNYLESLGKIAGLAEGMRKGVEAVGENMNEAVKGLISEMKKEIGALEEQYQKTFSDIAQLAGKFEQLNDKIGSMTDEINSEFNETLKKQTEMTNVSSDILKQIKDYFEKEELRHKEEEIRKRKKDALDHFDRSTLYYYRGNYELALGEIEKALDLDKLAEYLNLKGLILTELGRPDEAKTAYQEALRLEPNLAELYNNLGLLYIKTRNLNDAAMAFQEAIKKNVNYTLAYVHLGKVLLELERFDEAINAFEQALKIDPTNKEAKEAIALYKEGKLG
ncbi:MAG: tetratricopeptide repeat protein [candidate division WOR-3 bacterium]